MPSVSITIWAFKHHHDPWINCMSATLPESQQYHGINSRQGAIMQGKYNNYVEWSSMPKGPVAECITVRLHGAFNYTCKNTWYISQHTSQDMNTDQIINPYCHRLCALVMDLRMQPIAEWQWSQAYCRPENYAAKSLMQSWWVLLTNRRPRANLHQHMKAAKTSCNGTCRAIHVDSKKDKGVASYFKVPIRMDEAPFAVCVNHTSIPGVGLDQEATLSQIHMPAIDLQWSKQKKNTSSKAMQTYN